MIVTDNLLSKIKRIFIVNSLFVRSDKIGFEYLANKYVGVFIANKTGRNFGVLLTTVLYTIGFAQVQVMYYRFSSVLVLLNHSSTEKLDIEVEHLRRIFRCNNYPVSILDQCTKKFFDKLYVPKQIALILPKRKLFVVLPFLGKFALNLRKHLYNSISKSLPQCNSAQKSIE